MILHSRIPRHLFDGCVVSRLCCVYSSANRTRPIMLHGCVSVLLFLRVGVENSSEHFAYLWKQ